MTFEITSFFALSIHLFSRTIIKSPNRSCLFAAGSPTDTVDSQNFWTFSTRQIAFLVAERSTPALPLRKLLQCAGDIEMNPGPVSTPTPTNCLRLTQWNANGISGKITELLTFLHSNNVNIAAIQETKLTNKTKPPKTPGWAAVWLDRHNINGGVQVMLIKDTIPFVDHTVAHSQSADPHLEQQGISITMPNHQQLHIHRNNIPPRSSCSAGHNASIAHLLCNNEMWLIVGDINAHPSRHDAKTKEDEGGRQLAEEIDAADNNILSENEATRLPTNGRSPSLDISLTSSDIVLLSDLSVSASLASGHIPILTIINSEHSTIERPREPTSTSRKRTGHVVLKPAPNTCWSWRIKNCRASREDIQESSE